MRFKDYGDKRIIAALRPVLRRIQLQHYLHLLLRGLAGALLLSAFFLLLSFSSPGWSKAALPVYPGSEPASSLGLGFFGGARVYGPQPV